MRGRVIVPTQLAENAVIAWGDAGRAWAARIPGLVEDLCREWGLRVEEADYTLSFNFVVPVARMDGERGVLKLGMPDELAREVEALRIFDGQGTCRVLESDATRGAVLLERIKPGVPLLVLGERPEATAAAVNVIKRLRRAPPPGHALPRLVDWWQSATEGIEAKRGEPSPIPSELTEEADAIYTDLRAREQEEIVLHGDLHHWNILSSDRDGWLAIDPHGVTGPPECEVGAFMMNPNDGALARPDVRDVLSARLDWFAIALGYDREAMRKAALAYAVLSATWSAEDGGDRWRPAIDIASVLRDC